jgi:hypothetical protein
VGCHEYGTEREGVNILCIQFWLKKPHGKRLTGIHKHKWKDNAIQSDII